MNARHVNRARYIHFRANQAECAALERLCRLEQAGVSETMRLLLREGAKRRGLWPPCAEQRAEEPAREVRQ